jgi:flavin-dependent dehydrogenase
MVLDRARFPRNKPCAEYLSPEASRLLASMGVEGAVERAGAAKLSGMLVRSPNGSLITGRFAANHGFRGFRDKGLAIRRTLLDELLLTSARQAGAEVLDGWRLTQLTRDKSGRINGARGVTRTGSDFAASALAVVGADGINSTVAAKAGLARPPGRPRRLAIVAHFSDVADVGDSGEMHVERDGYLGIAAVDHSLVNVALVVNALQGKEIKGDLAGFMTRWISRRPHLAPRFASAHLAGPPTATGPFARRAARPWAPGAALVGDAADFYDPFTGEGIYTALRGGEMLAASLTNYCADPTNAQALRQYAAQRQGEFAAKEIVERLVGLVVRRPFLINRAAGVLERRQEMADLLVGVAGDFVPAREVLRPRFLLKLLIP